MSASAVEAHTRLHATDVCIPMADAPIGGAPTGRSRSVLLPLGRGLRSVVHEFRLVQKLAILVAVGFSYTTLMSLMRHYGISVLVIAALMFATQLWHVHTFYATQHMPEWSNATGTHGLQLLPATMALALWGTWLLWGFLVTHLGGGAPPTHTIGDEAVSLSTWIANLAQCALLFILYSPRRIDVRYALACAVGATMIALWFLGDTARPLFLPVGAVWPAVIRGVCYLALHALALVYHTVHTRLAVNAQDTAALQMYIQLSSAIYTSVYVLPATFTINLSFMLLRIHEGLRTASDTCAERLRADAACTHVVAGGSTHTPVPDVPIPPPAGQRRRKAVCNAAALVPPPLHDDPMFAAWTPAAVAPPAAPPSFPLLPQHDVAQQCSSSSDGSEHSDMRAFAQRRPSPTTARADLGHDSRGDSETGTSKRSGNGSSRGAGSGSESGSESDDDDDDDDVAESRSDAEHDSESRSRSFSRNSDTEHTMAGVSHDTPDGGPASRMAIGPAAGGNVTPTPTAGSNVTIAAPTTDPPRGLRGYPAWMRKPHH